VAFLFPGTLAELPGACHARLPRGHALLPAPALLPRRGAPRRWAALLSPGWEALLPESSRLSCSNLF